MEKAMDHRGRLGSDKTCRWVIAGIVAFALGIRLVGLSKGVWLDEAAMLRGMLGRNLFETVRSLRGDNHTPLMSVLVNLWSRMGTSEAFLRLPSVIFGVGTVAVVAVWMKSCSRTAGILAGICAATTPIFLRYSQEIHVYPLLLFATALAFLFASHVAFRPEQVSGYVGLAFSLALAVSTHLAGIMLLLPLCAFIALTTSDRKSIRLDGALPAVLLPCLIFTFILFVYFHNFGEMKRTWWMPPVSMKLVGTMSGSLFGTAALSWISTPFQNHMPVLASCVDCSVKCLALAWLAVLFARGDWRRSSPFLAAAVIYWAEIIGYSILDTPIFWDRILMPSMIPIFGFIALQTATIREVPLKQAAMAVLILLALAFTAKWLTEDARKPQEGWRDACGLLASQRRPNDLVVFYPSYAGIPVKFYVRGLPARATMEIPVGNEPNALDPAILDSKIHDKLAALDEDGRPAAIFLILRPDLRTFGDQVTYHRLLSVLAAQRTRRSRTEKIIAVWWAATKGRPGAEYRDELTASLESEFGRPASVQDGELFTMFEYGPCGNE
jgi:hypothetical protein